MVDLKVLEEKTPILKEIRSEKEVFWQNPDKSACGEAMEQIELGMEDVEDAERTLCALYGDVLEEQVVDGLPDAAVAGSHELFA